jgi:hypothetical protein
MFAPEGDVQLFSVHLCCYKVVVSFSVSVLKLCIVSTVHVPTHAPCCILPTFVAWQMGSHHSCICAHLIYCFARRCCYEDLIYCCICVQLCCKEAQCSNIFVPSLLLRSPHFLLYLCPPLLLGSLHLLIHSCPPLFLRKASVIDLFVPNFVC